MLRKRLFDMLYFVQVAASYDFLELVDILSDEIQGKLAARVWKNYYILRDIITK